MAFVAAGVLAPPLRDAASEAPVLAGKGAHAATREGRIEAVAVACDAGDRICLAYDGLIPGPTVEMTLGETIRLTLVNRIAETIAAVPGDEGTKARLARENVSLHVHGVSVAPSSDGVLAHAGTNLVASAAPPGGSYTYEWHATNAGVWHFHDHVVGGHEAIEGVERGLFAVLVVRAPGEPRADGGADVFLTDAGINMLRQPGVPDLAGVRGGSFEFRVGVHGSLLHTLRIEDPDGAVVYEREFGPGESARVLLEDLRSGTYVYRSIGWPIPHENEYGRLVVP